MFKIFSQFLYATFLDFREEFNFYACVLVDYRWNVTRGASEVEYKRKKGNVQVNRSKRLYTDLEKKHNFTIYFIYNILFVVF